VPEEKLQQPFLDDCQRWPETEKKRNKVKILSFNRRRFDSFFESKRKKRGGQRGEMKL